MCTSKISINIFLRYYKGINDLIYFKKHFYKYCLECFSSEKILVKYKEMCLKINGKQTVKSKVVLLNSKIIPDKYQLH